MQRQQVVTERSLAKLARELRQKAGKTKAQAGRELGVSRPAMQDAEERPERSMTKLRIRIIEKYSPFKVTGPFYRVTRRATKRRGV